MAYNDTSPFQVGCAKGYCLLCYYHPSSPFQAKQQPLAGTTVKPNKKQMELDHDFFHYGLIQPRAHRHQLSGQIESFLELRMCHVTGHGLN